MQASDISMFRAKDNVLAMLQHHHQCRSIEYEVGVLLSSSCGQTAIHSDGNKNHESQCLIVKRQPKVEK